MDHLPDEVRDELESYPNVVGTGRGRKRVRAQATDEEAVIVLVRRKLPDDRLAEDERVPETVVVDGEEVPTDVQEVGDVRAQSVGPPLASAPADRTRRYRPTPAGVSGAHPESTAGTIGTPPLRTPDGETVILTNAHVAAPVGAASEGDPFLQPGPADGGTADDDLGDLLEWSEIARTEPNRTDSALVSVDPSRMREDVLEVGPVAGWEAPETEAVHTKSGRTTGVTTGELRTQDTRIEVGGYYEDGQVTFEKVDVFAPMSAGGDSGSLIGRRRDDGFYGTHLLFAGSDRATIAAPLEAVREEHGELTPVSDEAGGGDGGSDGDGGDGGGGGSGGGDGGTGGGGNGDGGTGGSFEGRVGGHLRSAYGESAVSSLSNEDPLDFRVDVWPTPTVVTAVGGAAEAVAAVGPTLAAAGDDERPVVLYPAVDTDEAAARAGRRAGVPVLAVPP